MRITFVPVHLGRSAVRTSRGLRRGLPVRTAELSEFCVAPAVGCLAFRLGRTAELSEFCVAPAVMLLRCVLRVFVRVRVLAFAHVQASMERPRLCRLRLWNARVCFYLV
jgi:hypothetical protein